MTPLEKKKLEVEYHRVFAQRQDYELRLMELENSANQLKDSIEVQMKREKELQEKLAQE